MTPELEVRSGPRADGDLVLVNEPRTLWSGTLRDVRDLYAHRELLRALVARELRSRYKGARLGWLWALVRPLAMLLIYGIAVGVFLRAGQSIPQFMVFIYAGLIGWGLFETVVRGCISSVTSNGSLLSKARFPRLLLPLSAIIAAVVDFGLQASVLLVGYAIIGDLPEAGAVLWLIPALFVLLMTGLAVGLPLAAANVYARDVGFLTDIGLLLMFWMTPIIYSYGQVADAAEDLGQWSSVLTRVYMANPMANVAIGLQRALWPAASSPDAAAFAFPGQLGLRLAVFSVLMAVAAWVAMRLYVKMAANFGQEF